MFCALCYSVAPVLASYGSRHGMPPIAGTTLAVAVALPVLYIIVRFQGKRIAFSTWSRRAKFWIILSSITNNFGVLFYWKALSMERVSVVVSINSVNPLFTILIALLALRGDERLTPRLFLSAFLIIGGALLVVT